MSGVIYQEGLDTDFIHPLGKDTIYSEDGQVYRIVQRVDLLLDNKKYYNLKAVSPTNPIQQFQLDINDESKLTIIDCQTAITNVWQNVIYDGDFTKTVNYINNNILARCDVQNRPIVMSVSGTTFKLDFNNTIFTVTKT